MNEPCQDANLKLLRAGVPFCLPHKKEPKKATAQGTGLPWLALRRREAQGTGLPWLALRRREANSHATGVLKQVPPVAPDAAPSARPNPLGGSLEYQYVLVPLIKKKAALVKRALRNPQPRAVACPRRAGVPFCLPHKKEPKKSPRREPGYLGWLLGAVRQTHTPQACSDKCLP